MRGFSDRSRRSNTLLQRGLVIVLLALLCLRPSSGFAEDAQVPLKWTDALESNLRRGGPDTALSVWVAEPQGVTGDTFAFQSHLFLRHPDIQSDVWATPPHREPHGKIRRADFTPSSRTAAACA